LGVNDVIYPGQGYSVIVDNDCNLVVRGTSFDYNDGLIGYEGSGQLKAGWNEIGAASMRTHYWYVKGNCDVTSGPWGYDQDLAGDGYYLTAFLDPTSAYWLQVSAPCSLSGDART
jgi:hypothetical protein